MGELQKENSGTRPGPRRPIQNAKLTTMSLRGHHHNLRLNFFITEHGWIGAGGGPVEDFLCLVYAPAFVYLFAALFPFYTGHSGIAYGLQAV